MTVRYFRFVPYGAYKYIVYRIGPTTTNSYNIRLRLTERNLYRYARTSRSMVRRIGDDGGPAGDGEEHMKHHRQSSRDFRSCISYIYINTSTESTLSRLLCFPRFSIFSAAIRGPPTTNDVFDDDIPPIIRLSDMPATADFFYESQRAQEQAARDEITRTQNEERRRNNNGTIFGQHV